MAKKITKKVKTAENILLNAIPENNLSNVKHKNKPLLLKPTWKVLVLPVVIVLILLSVFITTKSMDKNLGDYSCKFLNLSQQFNTAKETQNNESLNRIMSDTKTLQQEMANKISSNKKLYAYAIAGNVFLAKIDPIYPVDCAFVPGSKFCSFYISEENYQCSRTVIEEQAKVLNRPVPKLPEYESMDYIMIIINFAIFFIIGYLISFLIALGYSKSKIRVSLAQD